MYKAIIKLLIAILIWIFVWYIFGNPSELSFLWWVTVVGGFLPGVWVAHKIVEFGNNEEPN